MNTSTHHQPATRQHQSQSFGLVLLLVLAMLWTQLFGLAHRVLHAPQHNGAVQWQPTAVLDTTGAAPAGLLGHLASPAQGEPDCLAYDQLGLSDTLTALPIGVLSALPPAMRGMSVGVALCLIRVSLFEARGPPSVR
jgi:hypothetical protein